MRRRKPSSGGVSPYTYQWIAPAVPKATTSTINAAAPSFSASLSSGETIKEFWRLNVKDSAWYRKAIDLELNFASDCVSKPTIAVTKTVNPLVVGIPYHAMDKYRCEPISFSCVAADGGLTASGTYTTSGGEIRQFYTDFRRLGQS